MAARTLSSIVTCLCMLLPAGCRDRGSTPAENSVAAAGAAVTEAPRPESWDGFEPQVADHIKLGLKAVREAPEDADAWTKLGRHYLANDYVDLAAPSLEKAVALDGRDPRRWYLLARARGELGDVDGALAAIDGALAALPYDRPDAPEQGHEGDDPGHSHGAPTNVEPATYDTANTAFLHWRRGYWLLEAGRLDDAQAAFARAMELQPDDPVAKLGLARVAFQREQFDRAGELLVALIQQPGVPNPVYVRDLLGRTYQRLGRGAEAEPLLATEPIGSLSWPDPWNDILYRDRKLMAWMIIQAHLMVAGGNAHIATHYLYDLEYYHSDNPVVLKILAQAYYGDGQIDKAIEYLEKVIATNPDDFAAHLNLAHVLEVRGEWDLAIPYSRRATELDPDNEASAFQLARLMLSGGHVEDAVPVCTGLTGKFPKNPASWAMLARAQAMSRDYQTARETLARGMELDRYDPAVQETAAFIQRTEAGQR